MHCGLYNIYGSKIHENNNTMAERVKWKHTVIKCLENV